MKKINEQDNFLINILTTADSILKQEKVFIPLYEDRFDFNENHLKDVGDKIAAELNGNHENTQLTVSNDNQKYSINLVNLQTDWLLTDLKKSIAKTWATPGISKSIPKIFELNPRNHYAIACQFKSADEILNDLQYKASYENYEQAVIHLAKFEEENPENIKDIKKLTDMVAMWKEHARAWASIYEDGKGIDYAALNERKRQEALTVLANENEAIKKLLMEHQVDKTYVSARDIYDLFKSFALEPSNNLALYLGLRIVETIMTDMIPANFTRSEDGEVVTHIPSCRRYLTIKDYLTDLNSKSIALKDSIKDTFYKKDGMKKKLSSRKYDQCRSMEYQLEKLNESINFVTKNQNVFKSYMSKWNPQN